jgi:hypothetical protein
MKLNSTNYIKVILTMVIFLWSYSLNFSLFNIGIHIIALLFFAISYNFKIDKNYKYVFLTIILIGIYSIIVGILNSDSSSLFRIISSSILFILVQWCILSLVTRFDLSLIFFNSKFIVFIIILSLCIDFIIFYPTQLRFGGLFKEPSHLAISIIPYLYYLLYTSKSKLFFYIFILIPIFLLSFSSTFIISFLFLLSIHQLRNSRKIFYLICILVPLIILLIGYVDYINSRVLGVLYFSTTTNQSSLVYIYGWESMFFYLKDSFYLGIGLNGMGLPPLPEVNSAYLLASKDGGDLYRNTDGSFLVSKIISELGLVGLFIIILIYRFLSKTYKIYESYSPLEKFFWNTLALLLFTSFIRGVGFFDGPFIMGSISYYVLKYKKKNIINFLS